MKLLTKDTDYAIRALMVLAANKGEYISARRIAEEENMPYQFLRRILNGLIKKGFIVSKEGGGGGFSIKADPGKIRIADVIRTFQGDIKVFECMFKKKMCGNRASCILRQYIQEIERFVEKKFNEGTINSLLKKRGAGNETKNNNNRRRKM